MKKAPEGTLSQYDVIFEMNGIPVSGIADWNEAIKPTFNGVSANIRYKVGGENGEIKEMELFPIPY